MPKISIIITTYNRQNYIAKAIESIRNQSFTDWELIIWDDGSTDNSAEIAQLQADQDARIRVYSSFHSGRGQALAFAHELANGEYLSWVDDDDLLAPTALKESAAVLDANSEIGCIYTSHYQIDESDEILGIGKNHTIPYSKVQLLVQMIPFHFRLIRRTAFELAGGIDPNFTVVEDYELCLRLSEITNFFHLKKPLYYYRIHQNNITNGQRPLVIEYTTKAINLALHRQGLDKRYFLREHKGKYLLCPI